MKNKLLLILFILPFFCGYTSNNVDISVKVGEIDVPVFEIEVLWDKMEFTYNETINYVWDDNTKAYELAPSNYWWDTSNNVVTIVNKSSFLIHVDLKYVSVEEKINGVFDVTDIDIKPNKTINSRLLLDGSLSSNYTNYIKIGTINLNIS